MTSLALPAPFKPDGEHIAIELAGARALFTTRRGGESRGTFASLNLGLLTDDDPAAVAANRARLERAYDVELAWGRQVHGDRVLRRDAAGPGEDADAQLTTTDGLAPMVLGADCVIIALAARGAVGAVHAGWRGLAAGVIARAVAELHELAARAPVAAAIGPGAGRCCYEVGTEVHERFAEYAGLARQGRNLDLKAIARAQLRAAGVAAVHDVGLCTICSDPDLFYSHRRDGGRTGRQAALVWLSR
jgi:hypothetical protein